MINELPILKENYIVAFETGNGFYAYKVIKKEVIPFIYDVLSENSSTNSPLPPLSPVGTNVTGLSPFYLDLNTLQLTSIQNVQDMFNLTRSDEVLQVFTGIQPSYVRFIYKQPTNVKLMDMDNNIASSTSFYQQGYDGFISPFNNPSPDTEIFVVPGLSFSMVLINTVSIPVNPIINFIINRMRVEKIKDPKILADIKAGKIPAKIVSLGGVFQSVDSSINPAFMR